MDRPSPDAQRDRYVPSAQATGRQRDGHHERRRRRALLRHPGSILRVIQGGAPKAAEEGRHHPAAQGQGWPMGRQAAAQREDRDHHARRHGGRVQPVPVLSVRRQGGRRRGERGVRTLPAQQRRVHVRRPERQGTDPRPARLPREDRRGDGLGRRHVFNPAHANHHAQELRPARAGAGRGA